jgi:hypothetical protein
VALYEVPGVGEFDAVPGADLEAGVSAGAYGVEDGDQVIPVLVELAIKGQICSFYGRLLM